MTPNNSQNEQLRCPQFGQLQAYRDRLLPEDEHREIASHLENCSSCRLEIEGASNSTRTETIDFPPHIPSSPASYSQDPNTSSITPVQAPLPAKLGQYELQGVIGRGGMGVVCKGWHTRLKRPVAIKLLHPHRCGESSVDRFVREMEAIGRLDHPNIVRALDADEKDGYHFLVMELLDGLTINVVVARLGPLVVAAACEFIRQAALGMQYAHEQKLVHRDIKPSNLLLTSDGTVKILDLGLALLRSPALIDERLTDVQEVMGTADYMSPEQGACSRDVDIRADIYSLGCTLYMLLSGAPPFADIARGSLFEKIEAHHRESVPSLRKRRRDVNVEVVRIVERMLAKNPADRFATPKDVADALAPFAHREDLLGLFQQARSGPSRSPEDRSSATTPDAPPGKRWWRIASVCLGLLVLVGWGAWFVGIRNPEVAVTPPAVILHPDVYHEMLSSEPKVLLFPLRNSRKRFDAVNRELWVDTNGSALFQLGETEADDYEIEVFVHQSQWGGGFGIFFGHQEMSDAKGKSNRFQLVEMGLSAPALPQRRYRLEYIICDHKPDKTIDSVDVGSEAIPKPGKAPIPFKVMVAKGRFQKVTWGGDELPNLIRPLPGHRVEQPNSKGAFGLFAHKCAITFRDARFLYREGKPNAQP